MTSLAIDSNNDILIENNDFKLVEGSEEVRQIIMQKVRTFYGEWFLETSIGIPYFEEVLVKNPNPTRVEAIFKEVILTTPGVLKLLEFNLDFNNATRQLTLSFLAESLTGNINVNSEVL